MDKTIENLSNSAQETKQDDQNKRIKIPGMILYIVGMVAIAVGISLLIWTKLGAAVISAVPYTIYEITNWLTIGKLLTIIMTIVLIIEIIFLKKATVNMVLTFATAYFMGLLIDMFSLLFAKKVVEMFIWRLLVVLGSTATLGFGAAVLIFSQYPPMPDLIFVRDLAAVKGWDVGKVKQGFDGVFFVIALGLSLIFLDKITTIGVATIISAFLIGKVVTLLTRMFNKRIQRVYFIEEKKLIGFLEFNLLDHIFKAKK
jgi:uncharacterized protein